MFATLMAIGMAALDPIYLECTVDGGGREDAMPIVIDVRNGHAILREPDTGRAYNRKARVFRSGISILGDVFWSIRAHDMRFHRVTGPRQTAVADTGLCRALDRRPAGM